MKLYKYVVLIIFSVAFVEAEVTKALSVTFAELRDHGELYDGKMVRVRGYYIFHSPFSVLYESRITPKERRERIMEPRVWIGAEDYGKNYEIQREGEVVVDVEGIFHKETYSETHFYIGNMDKIRYLMPETR